MPFLSGDSSITPRMVLDRGWTLTIRCAGERCGAVSPGLKLPPWTKYADVPIFKLYDRLRCSKCGGPVVEVVVSHFTGWGSKTVEALRMTERLE